MRYNRRLMGFVIVQAFLLAGLALAFFSHAGPGITPPPPFVALAGRIVLVSAVSLAAIAAGARDSRLANHDGFSHRTRS